MQQRKTQLKICQNKAFLRIYALIFYPLTKSCDHSWPLTASNFTENITIILKENNYSSYIPWKLVKVKFASVWPSSFLDVSHWWIFVLLHWLSLQLLPVSGSELQLNCVSGANTQHLANDAHNHLIVALAGKQGIQFSKAIP